MSYHTSPIASTIQNSQNDLLNIRFRVNTRKKRGSLYLLLIPRTEAFALPTIVERATQKPTPISIKSNSIPIEWAHR